MNNRKHILLQNQQSYSADSERGFCLSCPASTDKKSDPPPPPTVRIMSKASLHRAQDSIPNWSSAQPDLISETYRWIPVDKSELCHARQDQSCIWLLSEGSPHAGTMWRSEPKGWSSCDGSRRHSLVKEKSQKRSPAMRNLWSTSTDSPDRPMICRWCASSFCKMRGGWLMWLYAFKNRGSSNRQQGKRISTIATSSIICI